MESQEQELLNNIVKELKAELKKKINSRADDLMNRCNYAESNLPEKYEHLITNIKHGITGLKEDFNILTVPS